jgi:hypothetical protein
MTLTLAPAALETVTDLDLHLHLGLGLDLPEVPEPIDVVDQWGMDSFPASDPPANW